MKSLLIVMALMGFSGAVHSEETIAEKAATAGRDMKRAAKKGMHRMKEAVCMKDDMKCLAEKAKHRGQEIGDAIKDKATEVKDKVD